MPKRLANRIAVASGLQLLLVAGGFGLLSFSLGRRSGLASSELYRQNASLVELSTALSRKLSYPLWLNRLNLLDLQYGEHGPADLENLRERFWRQMQVFPVDYINFGAADGSFVGMERTATGALLLNEDTPRSGRGSMAIYALGPGGQRGALLERIPGMTVTHEEAWYVDTAKAGRPSWSEIYPWEDQPEVFSISYNSPLFGPGRRLEGVVGVDIQLSKLSHWLQGVWRDRRGLALIVEPNGNLVASSIPRFTLRQQGGQVQRANLQELPSALAQTLRQQYFAPRPRGGLQLRAQSLSPGQAPRPLRIDGRNYTLQATPWGRSEGLQWILLTALEADPSIEAAQRSTTLGLVAAALALGAAALLLNRQIRNLLRPLAQLQAASQQLSASLQQRDEPTNLQLQSGITAHAGEELLALDQAIATLVQRYNALTLNLQQARERERYRDAQTLALLKDKLRSSLQAAAVAHEINQPLSVLLLNSQMLLDEQRADPGSHLAEPVRQQLQAIRSEAERVVQTIEKMRALLRNVQTEPQRLDLREVALSAVLYARSSGSTAQLPIDTTGLESSEAPAWIHGDAAQVQIAVVNLLRNAAEALEGQRRAAPRIAIRLVNAGAQWCLEVEDNGPGLPANALEASPMNSSKATGSGLGLFVVRTTMDNHHGSLEAERSPGGGALLRLRFPPLPTTGD